MQQNAQFQKENDFLLRKEHKPTHQAPPLVVRDPPVPRNYSLVAFSHSTSSIVNPNLLDLATLLLVENVRVAKCVCSADMDDHCGVVKRGRYEMKT